MRNAPHAIHGLHSPCDPRHAASDFQRVFACLQQSWGMALPERVPGVSLRSSVYTGSLYIYSSTLYIGPIYHSVTLASPILSKHIFSSALPPLAGGSGIHLMTIPVALPSLLFLYLSSCFALCVPNFRVLNRLAINFSFIQNTLPSPKSGQGPCPIWY